MRLVSRNIRTDSYEIEKSFYNNLASNTKLPVGIEINYWQEDIRKVINTICWDFPEKAVLDVRHGFGGEDELSYVEYAVVSGVHISEKRISEPQESVTRIGIIASFQLANIDLVDLNNSSHIVFCGDVLHHPTDPSHTLELSSHFMKVEWVSIALGLRWENPFAQVGRKLFNPSTPTERLFKHGELKTAFDRVFDQVGIGYFFILVPLAFSFSMIPHLRGRTLSRSLFSIFNKIDGGQLRRPILRN
jgi:hypothetical protein